MIEKEAIYSKEDIYCNVHSFPDLALKYHTMESRDYTKYQAGLIKK